MLSIYNLNERVILTESIQSTIDKLIEGEYTKNGRKYYRYARIWYKDKKTGDVTKRLIQIYGRGKTKAGNPAIRAFQTFGETKTSNSNWKIFLIGDGSTYGIIKIEPTDLKWYVPINKLKSATPDIKSKPYMGPYRDKSFLTGLEKGVKFDNSNNNNNETE